MRVSGFKWSQETEEELLMSSVAWSLPPSSRSVPAVVSASPPLSGVSIAVPQAWKSLLRTRTLDYELQSFGCKQQNPVLVT